MRLGSTPLLRSIRDRDAASAGGGDGVESSYSAPEKPRMPRFSELLKSREVEDPVNVHVHRPLAYAFVAAIFRTRITPNQVTLFAVVLGLAAAACWLWGTTVGMVAGGLLLWASAIIDGADGFLSRAKGIQSQFGRALDGSADMIVAFATLTAGITHQYLQDGSVTHVVLSVIAILCTLPHLNLYDFYKDSYLRMTELRQGRENADPEEVEEQVDRVRHEGLVTRIAVIRVLLPYLRQQRKLIDATNPWARNEERRYAPSEERARIYRRHNRGPMQLWAVLSLAPHSYLFAVFGMANAIWEYAIFRLTVMNALFLVAVLWQRHATRRTLDAYERCADEEPTPERALAA